MKYKRIMIFGRPGAGKSTFATALSKKFNLRLYHIDRHFYTAKWAERNYQEYLEFLQNTVNQDQWIIDGNATRSFEMRYARADLVLYFNYPRYLCYWRVLKRYFFKNQTIKDRADGCQEIISWKLFKYMWTFNDRVKQQLADYKQRYPSVEFHEIKSDAQLNEFLQGIYK